ncbi:STB5-SIN3 binding protein [Fusarium pseudocircinatum]|uniref:STB5-SIN3 binding protein n=1 Tax=Fusarium pseudocircinatum TaxID=56676 RepID=A0A8H5KYH1_9HYPO|nr:STB5-SIN3 binding protein [Fusarium pseudocircinatum]
MNESETAAQQSQSPSASVPPTAPTPRRPLKRNSAACERCRRQRSRENTTPGLPDNLYQDYTVSSAPPPIVGHQDAVYHGRILRPTFAESNGSSVLRPALRGSPWQLWAGDPDSQPSQAPADDSTDPLLAPDSEALVEVFFTNRWPQLPFLHKPTFIQDDFLPLTRGQLGHVLSPFRVNMVLAIASAETNSKDSAQQHAHRRFFQAAIKDLTTVLSADDMDCIQCLLLLCLYGTNEPQSVNIWYTLGLALRIGLGNDLHREEASNTNQNLLSREMARRLFWCIYTLDRSMSIAMGRPLGINDSDITIPLPQQFTDEQLCSTEQVQNIFQDPKDMSTFLHVIKLRQINAAIYMSLHAASASASSECSNLDALREGHYADLNTWLVTAPRYGPASGVAMLQTAEWFQIAYHYAVLSLYRPSRVYPVSNISSLRLCADSAISLISCYNTLYAKNRISYTFVALNSLFMAAVTMLYALRSSPVIRSELSRGIAKANIDMCQRLLTGVSDGRSVGERCAVVVGRLGEATMDVFDREQSLNDDIDTEFMSWFGLKLQSLGHGGIHNAETGQQVTPSIDVPWNDLFIGGFDGFDPGNHSYLEFIV